MLLDAVAVRYGVRPSALLCLPPEDPRALALDVECAMAALRRIEESGAPVFPVSRV